MNLQKLIKQEGIENLRFTVPMRRIEGYHFGLFASYSSDRDYPTDCVITEDEKVTRYKVKDNYKLTLVALDDPKKYEHFYIMDLENMICRGIIKVEAKPAFVGD